MRVAVLARSVFPLHGYGGLERHVYDLVRHLRARHVSVTLVTRPPVSRPQDPAAFDGVKLEYVPYCTFPFAGRRGTTVIDRSTAYLLFGLRAGHRAASLVRRRQIDIVHGLGASALGYARVRAGAGAPLVLNPQGLEEFGATDPRRARLKRLGYYPLRLAVRRTARAADRVIATDRSLEPAVLAHLGVPRDRVRTIPNAIDLDAIDLLTRSATPGRIAGATGLSPSDLVLLSVGRLEWNKGFHVMTRALAALHAHGGALDGRSWRWVLVGDGPYRNALERMVGEMGLREHVLMTGRLTDADLHAWYEAATLFVHPTLYEGSSLVTLEAMAHRRAVVATIAGGLPDKVRPGVNGWLVEPGEPAALAAALSGALTEPGRLSAMGEASRTIVEEDFAWPAVTSRLLAVYEELLTGSPVSPRPAGYNRVFC